VQVQRQGCEQGRRLPVNVMVVVVRTLPRLLSGERWAIFLVPPAKSVKVGETWSGYTVCSWAAWLGDGLVG